MGLSYPGRLLASGLYLFFRARLDVGEEVSRRKLLGILAVCLQKGSTRLQQGFSIPKLTNLLRRTLEEQSASNANEDFTSVFLILSVEPPKTTFGEKLR